MKNERHVLDYSNRRDPRRARIGWAPDRLAWWELVAIALLLAVVVYAIAAMMIGVYTYFPESAGEGRGVLVK